MDRHIVHRGQIIKQVFMKVGSERGIPTGEVGKWDSTGRLTECYLHWESIGQVEASRRLRDVHSNHHARAPFAIRRRDRESNRTVS